MKELVIACSIAVLLSIVIVISGANLSVWLRDYELPYFPTSRGDIHYQTAIMSTSLAYIAFLITIFFVYFRKIYNRYLTISIATALSVAILALLVLFNISTFFRLIILIPFIGMVVLFVFKYPKDWVNVWALQAIVLLEAFAIWFGLNSYTNESLREVTEIIVILSLIVLAYAHFRIPGSIVAVADESKRSDN